MENCTAFVRLLIHQKHTRRSAGESFEVYFPRELLASSRIFWGSLRLYTLGAIQLDTAVVRHCYISTSSSTSTESPQCDSIGHVRCVPLAPGCLLDINYAGLLLPANSKKSENLGV